MSNKGVHEGKYYPDGAWTCGNVVCSICSSIARNSDDESLPKEVSSNSGKNKKSNSFSEAKLKSWSKRVKERDGYECVDCGATSNLNSHHIKPKSEHPDLAYDVENGETLCISCHNDRHPDIPDIPECFSSQP